MALISSLFQWLRSVFFLYYSLSSRSSSAPPSPAIRAANLGGWLVTEGWMTPWLFDNITNNDLLDGTQVQFKSLARNTYLTAVNGGGGDVVADQLTASDSETFRLWRITNSTFQFRVFDDRFVGLDESSGGHVVAKSTSPTIRNTFEIIRSSHDTNYTRIRAPNGLFLQVKADGSMAADYSQESTNWAPDDPSIFLMTIVKIIRGEFQLTNGYGRERAPMLMEKHWNSYIDEDDFKFMSKNDINTVRIPVGYWIAYEDNPPWPFIGGALRALDNAFIWAENHNIKVIVDLHATPGAHNSDVNSGTRDGSYEWGKTTKSIIQTLSVIDFLAKRYAKRPSFLALELINEPLAPGVTQDTLEKYYEAGYNIVRKYSSTCYVIMSSRYNASTTEFLQFAGRFYRSVLDVHYYHFYYDIFKNMTVQENIDFVYDQTANNLYQLSQGNGPLIFIGEWTTEWETDGATEEDYRKFVAAQSLVYSRATFGWGYWCLKNVRKHWSLEWMIENGYISLKN